MNITWHLIMIVMGGSQDVSPFSCRYPQPLTVRAALSETLKALGGRQTGFWPTGKEMQCV